MIEIAIVVGAAISRFFTKFLLSKLSNFLDLLLALVTAIYKAVEQVSRFDFKHPCVGRRLLSLNTNALIFQDVFAVPE